MTKPVGIICARCGVHLPAHATLCPNCRTPTPLTPERLAQMGVDINASVTWGEPLDAIRDEWLKKGAPAEDVQAALDVAVQERRDHFRRRGRWDLLIALGLILAGGIAYLITWTVDHGGMSLPARLYAIVSIAVIAAPLAGLLLGLRGLRRIFVGGESNEAASDISHSD